MKKFLAVLLAAMMLISVAACAKNEPAEPAEPADDGEAEVEVTDIEMWCIATETDSNRKAYEAAIEEVTAAHPEVNFTWEATQNQDYKPKIKAAVAADEMPDIFFTWAGSFLGDFAKAGRVYCLDDAYQEFKSELPEAMLDNSTYDGHHYAVPLTMNIVTLFANMDLLKEVGYDEVPGTYEDFVACCDALKAAGYIPLGCSGKEGWCVTEYVEPIIEKTAGAEALGQIFSGKATWDNEDVRTAVATFQELVKNGYFDPNGTALSNDEVKANFIAGKYGFYQNGSWNCGEFVDNCEFEVKASEFPVLNPEKSQLGEIIGGPSDSLAVAASANNPELTAKFAFELGRAICHYGYLDGAGLPAWTPDYDTSKINPLTSAVADICANAKAYVLFGDTALGADEANIYLQYIDQVYGAAVDADQFVDGLTADIG